MNDNKFEEIVDLFNQYNQNNDEIINIYHLGIYQDNELFLHNFKDRKACDIRSISKTVMTFTAGIVKEMSKRNEVSNFDENTYVYPIIENVIEIRDKDTLEKFKKTQVKHLLSHTIGYDEVLMMRDDIKDIDPYDYVDLIVNTEIIHPAGEYYLYSNAGFYLLAVLLQEFLQEDLFEFIKREFFDKLNFEDYHWDKYGNYIAAATRLWLRVEDLNKIGLLLLNDGKYGDQQLISSEWIAYMKSLTSLTPGVDTDTTIFRRYGYGKGIWLAKDDNIIFGHGTDGQIVAAIPSKNAVITTLSEQVDVKELENIVGRIIEDYL